MWALIKPPPGAHNTPFFSSRECSVFTKALALELIPHNIRVNCVCPGDISTPMLEKQLEKAGNGDEYMRNLVRAYPMGRVGKPHEVAEVICFLASEKASFV
ncbi:MAG: SDR family oxidoreductase, partial [Firmicutes bacterium]|nr:SDR family oxidoreductase [Bacillota bacterium]